MAIGNIILGAALRGTLLSVNRTQDTIDTVTQRLASGLKVNSALDQPQNFFAAQSLRNNANDHARLLDGIGQSVRTIQEAITGVKATGKLLDQAEAIVVESQKLLEAGDVDPQIYERIDNVSPSPIHSQILNDNPDVYYRLDETAGPIIDYGTGGGVVANYTGGASAGAASLYTNGSQASVNFDGINDHISVADSALINLGTYANRTVELVFNADTVAGRQILFEEGAGVNGLTIYIDNGDIRVTGEDDSGAQRWFNADISAPIVAGQTYHIAFVYDGPNTDFIGYLDGLEIGRVDTNGATTFPSHSGDIHIGGGNDGVQFHDGEAGSGNPFHFDGRISNVAIYNRALQEAELFSHADSLNSSFTTRYLQSDYENVLSQLDQITEDAHYRGVNLLKGERLFTAFNPDRSSFIETEGQDFSESGFGLPHYDFNDNTDLEDILAKIRTARDRVRNFGFTLANDLQIIKTRETFTREKINTAKAGADDLTVADLNQEGANELAALTRLGLGVTALALAGASQRSILQVVG